MVIITQLYVYVKIRRTVHFSKRSILLWVDYPLIIKIAKIGLPIFNSLFKTLQVDSVPQIPTKPHTPTCTACLKLAPRPHAVVLGGQEVSSHSRMFAFCPHERESPFLDLPLTYYLLNADSLFKCPFAS